MTLETKRPGPVVLADRDGTLIRNVPYLSRIGDIALLPGVASSIRLLNRRGIPVAIVTNQSGVARGFFPESFILESHVRILDLLEGEGATVQGFYYCPHLPLDHGGVNRIKTSFHLSCDCRKPRPGLLLRALADLSGDPGKSVMIGDADRDMEAALEAGCQHGYRILPEGEDISAKDRRRITSVRSFEEGVKAFLFSLDRPDSRPTGGR
jgi:D-glycero-D-manno-heptose 1,7-bisphosphate phosphatase